MLVPIVGCESKIEQSFRRSSITLVGFELKGSSVKRRDRSLGPARELLVPVKVCVYCVCIHTVIFRKYQLIDTSLQYCHLSPVRQTSEIAIKNIFVVCFLVLLNLFFSRQNFYFYSTLHPLHPSPPPTLPHPSFSSCSYLGYQLTLVVILFFIFHALFISFFTLIPPIPSSPGTTPPLLCLSIRMYVCVFRPSFFFPHHA